MGVPLLFIHPILGSVVFVTVYYYLLTRESRAMAGAKMTDGKKKIEEMKKGVAGAYQAAEKSTPKKLGAEAMTKKKAKK